MDVLGLDAELVPTGSDGKARFSFHFPLSPVYFLKAVRNPLQLPEGKGLPSPEGPEPSRPYSSNPGGTQNSKSIQNPTLNVANTFLTTIIRKK